MSLSTCTVCRCWAPLVPVSPRPIAPNPCDGGDGMHVFVETLAGAAEGTGERRSAGRKRFERPHVDADQLVGSDTDEISQGAIDAENIVLLVVDHDEVADGIEDFQPVAVGLV